MRTNSTRLTPGQGWVLALTSAASLMVSLDVQVVATALPAIRLHLHASLAALEWTVNAYTLSFAVLLLTGAALGYGPLGAGLRLLPGWAMLTVMIAPFSGALISRVGERPLVAGGLAMVAGSLTWTALIARTGLPYWHLVAPLLVAGCGASVAVPATMSAVMTSVPPAAIGQASGVLNTLRQLGGGVRRGHLRRRLRRSRRLRVAHGVHGRLRPRHGCLCRPGPARRGRWPGHPRPKATPATPSAPVRNHAPKIEIRR